MQQARVFVVSSTVFRHVDLDRRVQPIEHQMASDALFQAVPAPRLTAIVDRLSFDDNVGGILAPVVHAQMAECEAGAGWVHALGWRSIVARQRRLIDVRLDATTRSPKLVLVQITHCQDV